MNINRILPRLRQNTKKTKYNDGFFPHILITGTTAVFKPASVAASAVDNINDYKKWNN